MNRSEKISRARALRRNQTPEEAICWSLLRNRKFRGFKFLRQHPIEYNQHGRESYFITDFFCHELSLVIEIDGLIHLLQKDYDKEREIILKNMGYRILRFSNKAINESLDSVINKLNTFINNS
ncbi:endonuclease domain-containing protein [Fulvivirga sp.]|jgi:very-short-patch-repair endonuclease|uniref:endonuclease domain-containing protein n=1 Tax=Fulvivirga sp. TaxID=1931237 RepID=UPI0032ED7E69